jgi:excisionase family DNA binding protein
MQNRKYGTTRYQIVTDDGSLKSNTQPEYSEFAPFAVAPRKAAKLAGVGRSTLYIALASGDLKSSKTGKRRIILVNELERWIISHETLPSSAESSPDAQKRPSQVVRRRVDLDTGVHDVKTKRARATSDD